MGKLHKKVALITASGCGLGREVALKLASEGASIVVNDLDAALARDVVRAIHRKGGKAVACVGRVTAADFPDCFVKTALDNFGGVDIMVNNAGYACSDVKMTDEQWYATIDVHLTAPFRILRAAAGFIREAARKEAEQGIENFRQVVNISCLAGGGSTVQIDYARAKASILGMTQTLARQWRRYRVNVNVVTFGVDAIEAALSPGRRGSSAQAAGAVARFCYPESNHISGETAVCAGGARS